MAKDTFKKTVITQEKLSFNSTKQSNFLFVLQGQCGNLVSINTPFVFELDFTTDEEIKKNFVRKFVQDNMNNLFQGYSYLFGRFALQESLSFEFENKTIELLNNRRTFDPVAYVFDNIPVNKERFDLIELGNISDYVEVERFYNAHIIKKEVNTRPNEPCFVPADRSTFIYYGTTYNDLPKEFVFTSKLEIPTLV